jgi:7 transmembrane receptor (rhodopsin family)
MTNLLIVNQSFIDFCSSIVMMIMGIDTTDGTSMNRDSPYDQFVCRFWLSRWPLWSLLVASTYSILMLTLERYVAICHPVVYKVRN